MNRTRSRLGLAVGALTLPLLLSGCSGSPFGEVLSRSFSPSGAETPAEPRPTAQTRPTAEFPAAAPSGPGGTPSTAANPPATAPQKPPQGSSKAPRTPDTRGVATTANLARPASPPSLPAPSNPVPYRVTLRLPEADPAAPAEVVTQALRAAGVPFEVETIERLPRSGPSAPATTPAPAPPPSPAPAARPAPAPR